MTKRISSDRNQKLKTFIDHTNSGANEEMVYRAGKLIQEVDEIEVDEAFTTVLKRISPLGKMKRIYLTMSKYAAILVLPLIIFTIWSLLQKTETTTAEYVVQQVNCPIGMRSNITLPDGTNIWLNSESSIKYSLPFIREERNIELIGEAFLNVAKNEKSPFVIQSGKVKVDVLGTQFNFKSYPDDNTIEVSLKEGKIDLNLISGGNAYSKTKMMPGDHFVFQKTTNKAKVENIDITNFIGWKDEKLVFDDTPMPEMKRTLERWYGVEIVIADKIVESYTFTTTFENESLSQVLELLELSSPIKMEYVPGKIDRKKNQTIKSKIIISKKN